METETNLSFAHLAPDVWNQLALIPRTGWVDRGVQNPESVQDHIVALVHLATTFEHLTESERKELSNMLEIHDWAEAIHGDEVILSDDAAYQSRMATKFESEKTAMESICTKLGDQGKEIFELWMRFETGEDELADFARQLDKYQAVEKALEYELEQRIPLFEEFLKYSIDEITHPFLIERVEALVQKQNDRAH